MLSAKMMCPSLLAQVQQWGISNSVAKMLQKSGSHVVVGVGVAGSEAQSS